VRFARANRDNVVFLLDTHDTEAAATKVVHLASTLRSEGVSIQGVRLDSGDLAEHARRVRRILDDGGLQKVHISASGSIDEFELQKFFRAGVPIDGFGIGSRLDTSADAPYLDCAYKIQEYAGRPRRKRSEGKATWPGRKQVFRVHGDDGRLALDKLALEDEKAAGTPLIAPVMHNGKRLRPPTPLIELRRQAAAEVARLPAELQVLEPTKAYLAHVSPALRELAEKLDHEYS